MQDAVPRPPPPPAVLPSAPPALPAASTAERVAPLPLTPAPGRDAEAQPRASPLVSASSVPSTAPSLSVPATAAPARPDAAVAALAPAAAVAEPSSSESLSSYSQPLMDVALQTMAAVQAVYDDHTRALADFDATRIQPWLACAEAYLSKERAQLLQVHEDELQLQRSVADFTAGLHGHASGRAGRAGRGASVAAPVRGRAAAAGGSRGSTGRPTAARGAPWANGPARQR